MSARAMMTMRCDIERNVQEVRDGYNQLAPPSWEIQAADIHCFAWAAGPARTVIGEHTAVVSSSPGMMVPLGMDLRPGDRVREVRDRRGRRLFGMQFVDGVDRRATHLEARFRAYA